MNDWTTVLLAVYVAGAGVALARCYEPFPLRVVVALLWPLGPAALVAVAVLFVGVAAIAWPAVGVTLAGLALAGWLACRAWG